MATFTIPATHPDDPASKGGQRQPHPATASDGGFATRTGAKHSHRGSHRDQTEARPEIQQPSQHPRVDVPQKQLGKGRACSEEKSREKGETGARGERRGHPWNQLAGQQGAAVGLFVAAHAARGRRTRTTAPPPAPLVTETPPP